MIVKQLIVGNMGVCCYILGCEETLNGVVIDPGGNIPDIMATVEESGLKLKYIIATHGHSDHVCGNRELREKTGAEIVMHKEDGDFFGKEEVQKYFSVFGLDHSPSPDITVKDGDAIEFGKEKLIVIHTPGHTPGGICLYAKPHLFTGDTLFAGGIGRTDFPGGSQEELFSSIKERLFNLPDDTVVWPGHGYGGNSSTIERERAENPFF